MNDSDATNDQTGNTQSIQQSNGSCKEDPSREGLPEEATQEQRPNLEYEYDVEQPPKVRMNKYKSVSLEIPPRSVTPPTIDRVRSHCMSPHCEAAATNRVIRLDGTFEYTCDSCVPAKAVKVEAIKVEPIKVEAISTPKVESIH